MSSELACTYAALILQDDDVSISADKLSSLIKAADVEVEAFWPSLFAKALEGVSVKELIGKLSSGVGVPAAGAAAPAAAPGAAPAAAKEEKKEEKKEESEEEDEDMGFGLFD